MAKAPFFFREEKNQVFYHDVKIFIFGTDVTPWLASQVTLQKQDRDGITSLSFSLSNAYRAFELTAENLGMEDPNMFYDQFGDPKTTNAGGSTGRSGKFRLTDPYSINGRYSELAKAKMYTLKKQVNGFKRNIKWEVQSLGPGAKGGKIASIKNEDSNNATSEVTDRYPMSFGSLILHKYDPVRFFVKNPLTRSEDEWVCEFTGYLDTKPFSQNYTTGESVINVTCQDIRLLMQNMRVQVNASAQIGNENLAYFGAKGAPYGSTDPIPIDNGLFNDLVQPSGNSHILGGKTWLNSIKFLLFGAPTAGGGRRGALGKFKEGLTYRYDVNDAKKSDMLEKWTNLINFGVIPLAVKEDVAPLIPEGSEEADPTKFEMFPSSASQGSMQPGTFLTRAQMYALGTATVPDQPGSPDAGKVHFLLPAEGMPLHNMVEYNPIPLEAGVRAEFQSRLELLTTLCKTLDYQMYVTGMGDIILEFPMYDFQPTDYNDAYNGLYTFYDHIVSDNVNDEGGTPISALEVTTTELFAPLKNQANEVQQTPVGTDVEYRQTIFSSIMASRFGAFTEQHSVPGLTKNSRTQLIRLGYIEFNKRLANFNMFDFNTAFRPFVGLNRPIYHVRKQRFGVSKTVTYTWRMLEEVSLEISLQYVRKREGDFFRFITGGERQPISYRTIFSGIKVGGQGVSDTAEKKGNKVENETAPSNATNTALNESSPGGGG